jgi:hypothetical protein
VEIVVNLLRIALFFAMITSMGINNFSSLNAMKKEKKTYRKKNVVKFYGKGNKKIPASKVKQMKMEIILAFMQEFGISFKELCWKAVKNICLQDKKLFFTEGISTINVYLTKKFFANVVKLKKAENSLFSMKNFWHMFKIASKDACLLILAVYFYMFLEYLQKNLCDFSLPKQIELKNSTEIAIYPLTIVTTEKMNEMDIAIYTRLFYFALDTFVSIKHAELQYLKLKFYLLDIFMKNPIILQYIMQIIIFYMICYVPPFFELPSLRELLF